MLKWLFETINRDYTETNSDKALGIASSDFTEEVLKSSNWGRFFISRTCGNPGRKEIRFVPNLCPK